MCINPRLAWRGPDQSGLTLIELIVFIMIVGVALAGSLTVFNVAVTHSADAVEPKQATAVAEALLDEILAKDFDETVALRNGQVCYSGSDRSQFDCVTNYNGYANPGGIVALSDGSPVAGLGAYQLTVAVAHPTGPLDGVAADQIWQITVRVTGPSGTAYTLTGYRFNYG